MVEGIHLCRSFLKSHHIWLGLTSRLLHRPFQHLDVFFFRHSDVVLLVSWDYCPIAWPNFGLICWTDGLTFFPRKFWYKVEFIAVSMNADFTGPAKQAQSITKCFAPKYLFSNLWCPFSIYLFCLLIITFFYFSTFLIHT